MKIFVSGGTGVVGRRAVRDLVTAGFEVSVVARSDERAAFVESLGALPVRVSLFDREALEVAVAGSNVVVNLATSIPPAGRLMSVAAWKNNDRIRSEGSRNMVDAALAARASRYIQESITFLYAGGGDAWLEESSPIEPSPITASALDAEANTHRFTRAGGTGIVLRFGAFYGPDSEHTRLQLRMARMGIDPLPGKAGAYLSSISTDDAASAVVAALGAPAGIYNIVDDEPVTRAGYDRALAEAAGVRRVRRLAIRARSTEHVARSHRVSNSKFRAATGWAPRYPSVADGFPDLMASTGSRRPATGASVKISRTAGGPPIEVGARRIG